MKRNATLSLILALSSSTIAFAQSGDMKGMEMKNMKGMDMQQCHEMMNDKKGNNTKSNDMKSMDMKGMTMQQCHDMMHADDKKKGASAKSATHQATAVVKAVEPENGKITLAHEPVKSLKWPAMTMGFMVKDKALFDKLVVNEKVNVSFTKQGSDYVVTSVK